jgi:hypothetical protein
MALNERAESQQTSRLFRVVYLDRSRDRDAEKFEAMTQLEA